MHPNQVVSIRCHHLIGRVDRVCPWHALFACAGNAVIAGSPATAESGQRHLSVTATYSERFPLRIGLLTAHRRRLTVQQIPTQNRETSSRPPLAILCESNTQGCLVIFFTNFLALMIKAEVANPESNGSAVFAGVLIMVNVLFFLSIWWNTWTIIKATFSKGHVQVRLLRFEGDTGRLTLRHVKGVVYLCYCNVIRTAEVVGLAMPWSVPHGDCVLHLTARVLHWLDVHTARFVFPVGFTAIWRRGRSGTYLGAYFVLLSHSGFSSHRTYVLYQPVTYGYISLRNSRPLELLILKCFSFKPVRGTSRLQD